jgi:predicted ATPase
LTIIERLQRSVVDRRRDAHLKPVGRIFDPDPYNFSAPLITDLLELPSGERYPASALTAEQKRRRLLAALSGWVLGTAKTQPLVMVVEDLHWLDPSTLGLLQLLAEQGATEPLMLLCTACPEFHPPCRCGCITARSRSTA